jgi:cellulose biosynthesis protein BcsQ
MDRRMRGHIQMVEKLRAHPVLGSLICGIIPANEAVAYAHQSHVSVYAYDPGSPASQAYAQLVKRLVRQIVVKEGA